MGIYTQIQIITGEIRNRASKDMMLG